MSDTTQSTGMYQPDGADADFTYWAKMATWNLWEGAAVLVGINPNVAREESKLRNSVNRQALIKYKGIHELAHRALSHGELGYPRSPPSQWLDWARKRDLPIPTKLEAEVARLQFSGEPSPSEDRHARTGQLNAKIAELTVALGKAQSAAEQSLATRERDSMLKLIIGMAIQGYRYDPRAKRNDLIRDITNDLEKTGVPLSDDTIRKYLAEGAASVPPQEIP